MCFYSFLETQEQKVEGTLWKNLIPNQESMIDNYMNINVRTDMIYNSSLAFVIPSFYYYIIYSNSKLQGR